MAEGIERGFDNDERCPGGDDDEVEGPAVGDMLAGGGEDEDGCREWEPS